jgi:membrane-associated phospholipid phosphatase
MATLSAISRVHDNMHYLSDIIIGAGIGTIIGRGFSIQYKKRTKKHVYLLPSKKGVTLAVIF